jgi:hypothetical protein
MSAGSSSTSDSAQGQPSQVSLRKIAVYGLALCFPGIGHLIYHETVRGLWWLAALHISLIFYPQGFVVIPVLVSIAFLSVIDLYIVIHGTEEGPSEEVSQTTSRCSACRREPDPALDFCHWCGEGL